MISERDKRIIEYLKNNEADSKQLHTLFFEGVTEQVSRKRLKLLYERGHIIRHKDVDNPNYIYGGNHGKGT